MKHITLFLFLLTYQLVSSQAKEYVGNYEFFRGDNDTFYLKDKLTLNPNDTFLLSSEDYVEQRMGRKRLQYGKGTWISQGRLIILNANDSDIDVTHTLNLDKTKLRFDTKSPRDKSNRDIKTSVRIIDTKVSWLKGRTLIKGANTTPIINDNKCCKTIFQVHSYLKGKWKRKDEPNKEYHYSFEGEKGIFNAYQVLGDGALKPLNDNPTSIKILKTESGFEIETIFNGISTISALKHLNSKTLTTIRRDGKVTTLYRIEE